jgi:hypothetical protein
LLIDCDALPLHEQSRAEQSRAEQSRAEQSDDNTPHNQSSIGQKMNEEDNSVDLIAKAAAQNGVATAVLQKLLALESTFANFTSYGAKADFSRRVADILDEAAGQSSL